MSPPQPPPPRCPPLPSSRPQCLIASPACGSEEARAAPGASRFRRRPAVPASLPPPLTHQCRRRARRELPRRRGSPVAAIPSVLRSARRMQGARSSCLAASRRQHALALGASSSLRSAGDAPSLQDGRGFLATAGVEGRELPSRSDRPRGRGFPQGMTRWAGIPPSKPLGGQGGSPREPAVLLRPLPGDPGRNRSRETAAQNCHAGRVWGAI